MLSYLEHSAVDTETHAMQHFNEIYIITCIFLWQTVYGKCELKMCVIFITSYIDLIGSCVFFENKGFHMGGILKISDKIQCLLNYYKTYYYSIFPDKHNLKLMISYYFIIS